MHKALGHTHPHTHTSIYVCVCVFYSYRGWQNNWLIRATCPRDRLTSGRRRFNVAPAGIVLCIISSPGRSLGLKPCRCVQCAMCRSIKQPHTREIFNNSLTRHCERVSVYIINYNNIRNDYTLKYYTRRLRDDDDDDSNNSNYNDLNAARHVSNPSLV